MSERVVRIITGLGYEIIQWSSDPEDWKYCEWDPHHMQRYLQNNLSPARYGNGPIILQHDIFEVTVREQGNYIKTVRDHHGYNMVTMSKCRSGWNKKADRRHTTRRSEKTNRRRTTKQSEKTNRRRTTKQSESTSRRHTTNKRRRGTSSSKKGSKSIRW